MLTLIRSCAPYLQARLSTTAARLREDTGTYSWGQIIAGLVLLTAMWLFRNEFAHLFQYLVNSLFDALGQGDRGNGPGHHSHPRLGDGDHRELHTPGHADHKDAK